MRNARVHRAGNRSEQRLRMQRRLVVVRDSSLRNERRLLAVLGRQPRPDANDGEDLQREVPNAAVVQRRPEEPHREHFADRPEQALRKPQKRRQGHHIACLVQVGQLDEALRSQNDAAVHPESRWARRLLPVRQVRRHTASRRRIGQIRGGIRRLLNLSCTKIRFVIITKF